MSRIPAFSSPLLLGFDEIERLLDRVSKAAETYPPYNIERIGVGSPRLRIVLAVAGFAEADLSVTIEDNELTVAGRHSDEGPRDYVHRGIAARQFRRTFVLADGMEVTSAELGDGLLTIDLVRPDAGRGPRTIPVGSRRIQARPDADAANDDRGNRTDDKRRTGS